MRYVVDASVALKWFREEKGSEEALKLRQHPLSAPEQIVPECINALRKKVVMGRMPHVEALSAARALPGAGITFEPTHDLAWRIMELALQLSHPAYDCAYLALAEKLEAVLITADEKLLRRCAAVPELASRVQSLYDVQPMVQERAVRPYIARRRAA